MRRVHLLLGVASLVLAGCGTDRTPTMPPGALDPNPMLAKGGGGTPTLYKIRFVSGVASSGDGEIASDWFPDAGITMNARDPWKSVTAVGTIDLVNYTHGDWNAGNCASFTHSLPINRTNWDIAGTTPTLSFAGTWSGSVSVSSTGGSFNFYFDGDRVGGGGGIHNIASNQNAAIRTAGPNGDWYRIEYRNALLKFGSASSADGVTNPYGVEAACANFTLEARKVSLLP
jgi:hypothetical protein